MSFFHDSEIDTGKALSKVQALIQLIQKNLGTEHKTQRKKHTHTHTHTHTHWGWGAKNKEAVYWGKSKGHREECSVLASEGCTLERWGGFFLPHLIFSPLNGWGSFWLGMEYSLRGGLRCGLDCTRLHQLLVLCICLLKPPFMRSKSYFPLNFPFLVEHHTWEVILGHQQPVHFYLLMLHCFHGESFLLRCYKVSVLDAIPPCVMASLSAKQGGGLPSA